MSKDDLQRTIGFRVKAARNSKKLNQDALADALQLKDRQTISDIENGKRAITPNELVLLSDFLDKDIEFFIDPFNVVGEAQFSWRASNAIKEDDLNCFEYKAGQWVGLLRWLQKNNSKSSNIINFIPRISRKPSYAEVSSCAEGLVKDFNLGEIPANNLLGMIENKFNVQVIFVDCIKTPDNNSISGASCHLSDFGVIIINRNEPESRRNFDLAHELFHILTWNTMQPGHRECNSPEERAKPKFKKIEQLADTFAASLLMPKEAIDKLQTSSLQDVEYLLQVAQKFKVSPIALGYRLLNLNLINENIVSLLKNVHHKHGITPKPFSKNFAQMLHTAIIQGQLSARKAAKAMDLSLEDLKDLFSEYLLECPFDL